MKKTGIFFLIGVSGILAIVGIIAYFSEHHPTKEFDSAVAAIGSAPKLWIERQVSLSTYRPIQPIIGPSIRSKTINSKVVEAYELLCSNLEPIPTTYYSDCGDMPTQETIWQFQDFFVRLYVASSLESDGAAIGVFSGAYPKFREGRLSDSVAPHFRFTPISFEPPSRFLSNR
ncbi:MAG: hypothetical protein KDN19_02585 [Verrucomicrobiae bacterium]|nr:hypothetical protein [Verrucomicrobiae bacterium]